MANVNVEISSDISRSHETLTDNALRIPLIYFGWLALFFATGWLSKVLIPKVRTLKPKEQMFWQLAMVRGIVGLLTFWAINIVFIDGRIARDHVLASTDQSWTFVCTILAFFIFEELTLIYFDIKYHTFSSELHMHHFFSFSGYFLAAYYHIGHYYSIKAFVLEASTPFSCICWCLLKLKLEKTKAWKINQWILIYIFHLRSVYELWWWYEIYQDWNNIKQNMPWLYTVNMFFGLSLITFWLTPYWTYKKTVQLFDQSDWNAETKGKKKEEIDKTE